MLSKDRKYSQTEEELPVCESQVQDTNGQLLTPLIGEREREEMQINRFV